MAICETWLKNVFQWEAEEGSQGDEHRDPQKRGRYHASEKGSPSYTQRSRRQRGVDPQTRNQPSGGDPEWPGLSDSLLYSSQRPSTMKPPRDRLKPVIANDGGPCEGQHRPGDA